MVQDISLQIKIWISNLTFTLKKLKPTQGLFRSKLFEIDTQVIVSISLCRAAQHELEKDSGDKFIAQSLDEQCHGLRNSSRGIAFHNGVHRIDNT